MPFCANCGSPVEGKFCAKCGSPVSGTAAPSGAAPAGAYGTPVAAAPGLTDNAASALCYALGFLTGILFLVLEPYNKKKNIRFHAFQSIFLNLAVVVVFIGLGIVSGILYGVLGFWMTFMLARIVNLACLVLWIFMIVSAYQGKTIVVPVVGPLAQQQA